jgi:alginate O-acetyltransferase complex protein AlgI
MKMTLLFFLLFGPISLEWPSFLRDTFFSWDPAHPLTFMQPYFWFFFTVVLLFYSFLYRLHSLRTAFLLAVSLYFYFKTSGVFLLLLLFTIINDYTIGRALYKATDQSVKKALLSVSIFCNLALLGYFKYAYFFLESYNQMAGKKEVFFNHYAHFTNTFFSTQLSVDKLVLPVGISFFTFQSISYIVDLYRGKVTPVKNMLEYGFFVSFFPHLVAGPIVKSHEFLHQIRQPYVLSRLDFGMAVFWILNGFGKKVLADYLAVNFVDRIFAQPSLYSGVEVIAGILGYSLQIYADFSGYTDMAIGIALILGFRLKTNFLSPYKAASTSEFWQRWHISLSSWLKEYLYIPLGGNKSGTTGSYLSLGAVALFAGLMVGEAWVFFFIVTLAAIIAAMIWFYPVVKQGVNTHVNLLVTMLLGGLWHGSSWMFLIWGGLNGLGLIIHKWWQNASPWKDNTSPGYRASMVLLTLLFISFTRIWFRSENLETVGHLFHRIGYYFGAEHIGKMASAYAHILLLMLAGYLIHWIPETSKAKYRHWFANLPLPVLFFCTAVACLLFYQAMSAGMQPFIYFQF